MLSQGSLLQFTHLLLLHMWQAIVIKYKNIYSKTIQGYITQKKPYHIYQRRTWHGCNSSLWSAFFDENSATFCFDMLSVVLSLSSPWIGLLFLLCNAQFCLGGHKNCHPFDRHVLPWHCWHKFSQVDSILSPSINNKKLREPQENDPSYTVFGKVAH